MKKGLWQDERRGFTFGGESLIPHFAATSMFLLVARHEKRNTRLQECVPGPLGNGCLAPVDGFDSLWIGDRELPGTWVESESVSVPNFHWKMYPRPKSNSPSRT